MPWLNTFQEFADTFLQRTIFYLKSADVYLILDRYFPWSIKGGTRQARIPNFCQEIYDSISMPLPLLQSTMLKFSKNKVKLIEVLEKYP